MHTFSGPKFRALRRKAGLSAEVTGVGVGRSYTSILHYETGRTVPPDDIVVALAHVVGCSPAALYIEVDGLGEVDGAVPAERRAAPGEQGARPPRPQGRRARGRTRAGGAQDDESSVAS